MSNKPAPTRRCTFTGGDAIIRTPDTVGGFGAQPQRISQNPRNITTTFAALTNQSGPKIPEKRTVKHRITKVVAPPPAAPAPERESASFYRRDPPVITAAPFPKLPTKSEVIILIQETESELSKLKRTLAELYRARKSDLLEVCSFGKLDPSVEIQDHFGMVVPHKQIQKIMEQNRKKIEIMRERTWLRPKRPVVHTYCHTNHYCFSLQNVEQGRESVDAMFRTVCAERTFADEKARDLTRRYMERRAQWNNFDLAISIYHRQARELLESWPPEMIPTKQQKDKDKRLVPQSWAKDEPMYLDDVEFYTYAFYNMNGFVEDPVKAHNDYRKRLVWTDTEKQIFLDKYRLHPREFRKIAAGLPNKSVKDCIEFYYVHRIDMKLKELEQMTKKRGRKKMLAEGAVRK